jgi:D-serine deaminase-like pyridoxal phosphate-dependent protein
MGRMTALETLETPALILDRARLVANCERMRAHLAPFGVPLRPHVKTAKSSEVARLMHGGGTGPVTVSTLKEAEFFLAQGFDDLLYAVGLAPNKFARVAALARAGARLQVIVDSAAMAWAFREFCGSQGLRVPVLIEIDSDDHRAGIRPDSAELLRTAAALDGLLGGVLTHAGNSYGSTSVDHLRRWARIERQGVTAAAECLRSAGHEVPVVSLGSTPTALFAQSFEGVSEVRAGVYVFFDLVMAGLGVCALGELALSVLASVIGHQAHKGWLVIDAGWMALSRDRGTQIQRVDQGYGLVCDARGEPLGDLIVVDANQEHGIVASRSGERLDVRRYPVGSLLRVLPNHACATAAQHAAYHVVGAGGEIEARWERLHGW